jgi:hypothetical protein
MRVTPPRTPRPRGTEPEPTRVALVGMSGAGKSLWARRLAEAGFRRFGCDRRIADRLAPLLGLTRPTLQDVGRWMGMPYDPGYAARAAAYLELEELVLNTILDDLAAPETRGLPVVIDTTGSVIYTAQATRRRLRRAVPVVHLACAPGSRRGLLASYVRSPRPVLWQGYFARRDGESHTAALARCYPHLLEAREAAYDRLAHGRLDETTRSAPGFDAPAFAAWIASLIAARMKP